MKPYITLFISLFIAVPATAELAVEPIPAVATLPKTYPENWLYVQDTNFMSLLDARVIVVDVAARNRNYKGSIPTGQFPSFLPATSRSELYVAETVYSRRVRGERIDLLTIYDKANLAPIDEIILPGGKRGQLVTHKNSLRFLNDEKFVLLFNFTPAASVLVIDIVNRQILNEVSIGACSMIYPSGKLSFASLCGDNTMLITHLDKNGKVTDQQRSKPFFNADIDPLFAKPVMIAGIAYFPSFKGNIQTIDMRNEEPQIGPSWSLVNDKEKAENWRPGGWQIITADTRSKKLYVLMHKEGFDGSHKQGGSEVWVYAAATGKKVQTIVLQDWGVSIQVTQSDKPYLAVTNENMDVDIYAADSGEWQQTIGDRAFENPFIMHAVN